MDCTNFIEEIQKWLAATQKQLCKWLDEKLPGINPSDWQNTLLLPVLEKNKRYQHPDKQDLSIKDLDLAALLKIFGDNWKGLQKQNNLPHDSFGYMKEMPNIRNRWAHQGSNGVPLEEMLRDADTMHRFLKLIDFPESRLNELHQLILEMRKQSLKNHGVSDAEKTSCDGATTPLGELISDSDYQKDPNDPSIHLDALNFVGFITESGNLVRHPIEKCDAKNNPEIKFDSNEIYPISIDWKLPEILKSLLLLDETEEDFDRKLQIAAGIWKMMGSIDPKYFKAICRTKSGNEKFAPSMLIQALRDMPWLPSETGWSKPCDLNKETIYNYDSGTSEKLIFDIDEIENGWLEEVGFGN